MGRNAGAIGVVLAAGIAVAALLAWKAFGPATPALLHVRALNTLLVRTDYSDADAWAEVRSLIRRPSADGFLANVDIIDDQAWSGMAPGEVVRRLYPDRQGRALMVLADARTMRDPEHALLCVDPRTLESLRVVPSLLWSIENNLSLANLDWRDFAENVDKDGVLRGLKDSTKKALAVSAQP